MKEPSIRHEIENTTVVIVKMSLAIQPIMDKILSHIECQSPEIISSRQLDILKKSMQILQEEALKLKDLSKIATEIYPNRSEL